MKYILIFFFCILRCELFLLDSIAVLRIGSSGLTPIYSSDCWFSNPLMGVRSLLDCIIDSIWLSYGAEHGIKMMNDGASNEYAEQYFDMISDQKKISKKQISEMVAEFGFTLDDIRKFLNNQYLINQTIETFFMASGKLNITHDEILDYYNLGTFLLDDIYTIKSGILSSDNKEMTSMEIENFKDDILWDQPFTINKKDLSYDLARIDDYNIGDIVYYEYDKKNKEYVVYKYEDKVCGKIMSIEDCYEDIMRKIQAIKYTEGYKEMTIYLTCLDSVIYDDPRLKSDIINLLEERKIN